METVKDTPELNKEEQVREQQPQITQEQVKQYMQEMQIASAQMGLENSRLSAIQKTLEMKKSKLELLNYSKRVAGLPSDDAISYESIYNEEVTTEIEKQRIDLIKSILAMKI